MTARPLPEALNPQKGNIMSIIRHEIRQILDENRGQPIISQAVVHGNVAYFADITPNPIVGDIKTQTAQVLRRVEASQPRGNRQITPTKRPGVDR